MIESVIGYVISGLSFFAGIHVVLMRNIDSELLDSRRTIKDEFIAAYREFSENTIGETIDRDKLNISISRLKDLHCASYWDLNKLRAIEWLIRNTFYLMIFVWLIVAISLMIGHFGFDENRIFCRVVFFIVVPGLLLLIQVCYLNWMLKREQYLKRITDSYKNLEYKS